MLVNPGKGEVHREGGGENDLFGELSGRELGIHNCGIFLFFFCLGFSSTHLAKPRCAFSSADIPFATRFAVAEFVWGPPPDAETRFLCHN